jgi:glycosyltransferase involved in cell wall biosynthesis
MLTEKFGRNFSPLVSIIIPVYNGSNYVAEAIDSALAQTYKNIEIIVVNDGSTDNSEEIIKSYGNKLRYFKKENGGVSTALNLGIKKSKGEYISWLSHDDVYYPEKIETQISELGKIENKNRSKTILMSNFAVINKNSKVVSETHFENDFKLNSDFNPLYPILLGIVNGCTLLIPKICIVNGGYFDEELKLTQDYDLWFKIFPKCRVIFMNDLLVKMRVHRGQGTWKIKDISGEYDFLWIKIIKKINDSQKKLIFGSVNNFYKEVYKMVNESGYVKAEKYLIDEINRYELKIGQKINLERKVMVSKKEKYYLDKIYRWPIFGVLLVKVYFKIRSILKLFF